MTHLHDTSDDIDTQAIIWHVRLRRADAAERHAFDLWLAQDVRHAAAFAAIHETSGMKEPSIMPAEAAWRAWPTSKRRWLAGSVAATVMASTLMLALPGWRTDPYDVTTAAGKRRIVALDAETKVTLNGNTRMRFDRHNPRVAALIEGEALFEVRHDAARPFRLDVAGRTVEDLGTIFNVVSNPDEVRVAVAEGAVIYNPESEALRLRPGKGLVDAATSAAIRLVDVPAASIGAWRNGQFRYAGTALSSVASDLSRALGVRIAVTPAIANQPFTGAITLEGDDADQLARLTPVLQVGLVRMQDGWLMRPLDSARR